MVLRTFDLLAAFQAAPNAASGPIGVGERRIGAEPFPAHAEPFPREAGR